MRGALATVCAVIAATSAVTAADVPATVKAPADAATTVSRTWSVVFDSDVRYSSWRSNLSFPAGSADSNFRGSGSQLYIPYALQLIGQPNDNLKIEIVGRGGWVRSRQTSGDRSGEVSTTTDTQLVAAATYLGINGVQPFVSVSFNIPTGKSALFGTAANARMDSDLVDIATFGEGLNVGPTLGVTLALANNLITSFSVGYTQRGTFTREGSTAPVFPIPPTSEVNPADVVTGTASLGYQVGQLVGTITGTVSSENDTKVDGLAFFRAGMRYVISGTASYTWPDIWGVTNLSASFAHADKNKVLFILPAGTRFDIEPFNSNSNLYRVGIEHLFVRNNFAAGPIGSFLYRDRNGYDSQTLQFVSAKERWTAGLLARYAATERILFNARVEHVWIHENPSYPASPFSLLTDSFIPTQAVPAISSTGWQGAFGATVRL
jgi:hypothetical protein